MIYKQSEAGGYGNDVYTDSTFTKKYIMLTNGQKKQLLWNFFNKDINGDVKPDFFEKFMQAYFVAKQPSVNGFQPIILSLSGDDYHALTMVLLDKNNKPVNSFKLTEGMLSGPIEEGDSLLVMQTMRQSIMKGDIIITKEVTQSDFADSLKRPSLVDSVVFRTVIDKGGNFKTKKFSTSHYTLPYRP